MPRRAAANNLTLPDSALSVCASHMSAEILARLLNCCLDPKFRLRAPALPQDSDTQLLRARPETILWIKTQVARYGPHLSDLENAGCFAERASIAAARRSRFRDAQGNVWDSHGGNCRQR